jgi:hypothetical protein
MKLILEQLTLLLLLALAACTQTRARRYSEMIDPLVGSGKKEQLDKLLGIPAFCRQESAFQKCEYRTASAHNAPTPIVFEKLTNMPDVSPYEYFDVIHLFYDDQRVLKEWQAVVLKP